MNRILIASLFAATACVAAPSFADTALAGDISIDPNPFVSTRTRGEVMAEFAQFRASGVNPWADEYNQLSEFHGERSRAEVAAEFMETRNEVAAMNGEDSGSMYLASRTILRPTRVLARNTHGEE
jgi:hypothetical protein